MRKYFIVTLFFAFAIANAKIIRVPADFAKIQSAINATTNGDTVVVFPGTYFENINFKGKNIILTSRFYETGDVNFISSTIINGSKPANADMASCVLVINGEDTTTVLQGFTLTGGKGTAWQDEHSPGRYREGGGILTAFSSPIIKNNYLFNNEAINRTGLSSAGGGAIRSGDGNPQILNNIIMNNKGLYGGGIVLNYCGAIVRNNIVVGNDGGQAYGGGGLWMSGSNSNPKILENNTIVGNHSVQDGGGLLLWETSVIAKNNIIYGNSAASFPQISLRGAASISITYSDVEGGWNGNGNINTFPLFADSALYLTPNSPCVDAGDTSVSFNDNNLNDNAIFPSQRKARNDMGAYGGSRAKVFANFAQPKLSLSHQLIDFGKINSDTSLGFIALRVIALIYNNGSKKLFVDSIRFQINQNGKLSIVNIPIDKIGLAIPAAKKDSVIVEWKPTQSYALSDTLLIYHNDPTVSSPFKLPIIGNAFTIIPTSVGVLYAASGVADTAKVYTIDTSSVLAKFEGATGFSQVNSIRINPKNKELYGLVVGTSTQLIRISSVGAANFTLSTISIANPKGMAFGSDGKLYMAVFNGTIYSIDPNTGDASQVTTTGLKISGLAFNPVTGILWASVRPISSGKDNIYKINLANGSSTFVGATGFGAATKDITFDSKGKLFGVIDSGSTFNSYLISIDTATAKGTVLGNLGVKGIEAIELRSYFVTSVNEMNSSKIPTQFVLNQNYPNPFNPSTVISYQLPVISKVTLKIYDVLGREVATLVNEEQSAGWREVQWNAKLFSSGIYFYTLRAGSFLETKKLVLMK